jgi:CRP-like cAMP-binding protein
MSGTVGRYHLLSNGRRQYLSFHIIGDMPNAQGLFIDQMDHAVCAMGRAEIAFIPHGEMVRAFKSRPSLAFAVWRETLIDAAIFREAITRVTNLICQSTSSSLARPWEWRSPRSNVPCNDCAPPEVSISGTVLSRSKTGIDLPK